MKSLSVLGLMTMLVMSGCVAHHSREVMYPASAPACSPARIRVGVYDSRAVALAYCGGQRHEAEIARLDQVLKAARESGDAGSIRKADRAVWEARMRLHRQGFSTHPVDDILDGMPEDLERIRREAGVGVLVSRWDRRGLRSCKNAEQVDVTEQLVQTLTTVERKRRQAMEITRRRPISRLECELLLMTTAGRHYW